MMLVHGQRRMTCHLRVRLVEEKTLLRAPRAAKKKPNRNCGVLVAGVLVAGVLVVGVLVAGVLVAFPKRNTEIQH